MVGAAQAMYEAVFRSLGSAGYGQRFSDMARRLPWRESQRLLGACDPSERPIMADALVFGTSGLLQRARGALPTMDDETRTYVAALNRAWTRWSHEIQQPTGRPIDWRHPHVRPMNTPERRLAAMAQLLLAYGDTDLCRAATALSQEPLGPSGARRRPTLIRAWIEMLQVPAHAYWSTRSRFGSRSGGARQQLIGRQRALTMVVDAVLPVLLGEARAQGDVDLVPRLLASYRGAPRLPDNAILRDMSRRLLGDDPELLALVTHARQQQGMLQIFEDYCSHDEGGCQGCGFPLL